MFGSPALSTLTREELEWNIIRAENHSCKLQKWVDELIDMLPDDVPLPAGLGHWDRITKRQNQAEGARRREARV